MLGGETCSKSEIVLSCEARNLLDSREDQAASLFRMLLGMK